MGLKRCLRNIRNGHMPNYRKPYPEVGPQEDFFLPRFKGQDICDLIVSVTHERGQGKYRYKSYLRALRLASRCMEAMIESAKTDPENLMEFYVNQVATVLWEMNDLPGVIALIEEWLARDLTPPRLDQRLLLEKRLVEAKEALARTHGQGVAASAYHEQWLQLCEKEKTMAGIGNYGSLTGASRGYGTARPRVPKKNTRFIPAPERLHAATFVAVDFETANRRGGVSACQIALVKIADGKIIDRYTSLIQPPQGWQQFEFTYIHGITARDVSDAPQWSDIAQTVHEFVDGAPVYAHNASFDAKVWRDLDQYFGLDTVPTEFYCSFRTARRMIPGLPNYKLPTVTAECAPGFVLNHHDASSDAEACALIVKRLQEL